MADPPSLLMVSTVPPTIEGFLVPIAERMRERGWRVEAAAAGAESSEPLRTHFDRAWDVEWSRDPLDPSNLRSALGRMRRIAEEGRHDLVHVHTPVAGFVTRAALRGGRGRGGPRLVYTAHGFHFHERNGSLRNAAFLGLEKMAGRWTDRLVLINRDDVEQARRHAIVPDEAIVYMPGIGIDTARYDPGEAASEREEMRREIGLSNGEPLFAVLAEFIPRKRNHLVVEALSLASRHDIHVAFVGEGPTIGQVRASAEALGVSERTHFLGWRDDVPRVLAAADGSVLFSNQEGLSRAVMESLAMRCPVVGADIRGIRELVEGGCGIAVDPDDPQALADSLRWIADHPAHAARMGALGRKKMEGPYHEREILAAHERLYEDVLAHA